MAADKTLMWSTEEINLSLHVVIDYKEGKTGEGVDWEMVRSKYEDVTKMFLEKYPDNNRINPPQICNLLLFVSFVLNLRLLQTFGVLQRKIR